MSQVLFLSNDPVLKEKNMEILQQSGLEANGTSGCLDGLVMMDKNNFDVIVIDDELSDVSGYEACLKVRQQQGAMIVLLGTIPESDAWSRVEELGFDLYLRKPVSPRELLARIKALLRRPGSEKGAVEAAAVQPMAAPRTQDAAEPARNEAITAGPKFEERRAFTQTAARQPVSTPQPAYGSSETPEPAVRGLVYSQSQPAPVKPEMDVQQQAVPAPERIIVRSSQPQAPPVQPPYVQQQVPPVQQQAYVQPPVPAAMPPTPVRPLQEALEKPVVIVPKPVTPQWQEQAPVTVPPLGRDIKKQASAPFVINQPAQQAASVARVQAQPAQEEAGTAILEDPRVIKLVDALVSGKLPDINPVVDFSYKMGFAYPAVNSLLDTSEVDTINILESLSNSGILIRQSYEKFYIDPDGLFQLVPIERCPRCDSSNIVKGQLVEHFSCGYVGLDRDFKQDSRYVCPKCRKELRLIGTDYRNVGIHYRCQDCSEVFTVPVVKWRNMKTRKIWTAEELKEVEAYSYQFSPDKKGWLEFQLKPKTQLVDFLKHQGYQVHELAQLTGRSGAVHTVDVLAIRDDIITKINLGIGILLAPSGEPEVGLEALFRFDTRAYDIGINYKVVIAIPRLGQEALNFAGRQMIRAFEAKTMATVVADITHLDRSNIGMQSRVEAGDSNTGSVAGNARGLIVRFLRNRGYEVYERALILGKSGIEHIFDIFARRDDKIVVPTVAIGIGNEKGQPIGLDELSKFDAAAFDTGIRNKVFLGLSEISTQAKQFAMQQKIDIIEQQDLRKLT
jgi:DNA-binding response OmpR family regulator/DNA-directed RNA polymerase subunit RPC12/RpoP